MGFEETEASQAPPSRLYLLSCFLLVLAAYPISKHGVDLLFHLTDAHVLAHALNDWLSGKNPYTAAHGPLRFVYPPLVLYAGGALARFLPRHWGWALYLTVNFASVLALPIILRRFYFRQSWLNLPFLFLIFLAEPQFATILALNSGNIACILYALAFLAAAPGLEKNRWGWLYAVVFVAAGIKVTFLLMLFLPLFAGRRQWGRSLACAASVAAVYFFQRLFMPQLYSGYRQSVTRYVIAEHQYGFGSFGIPAALDYKFHHAVGALPYAIAVLFTAALFGSLFLLRRRLGLAAASGPWPALVIVAITLANPRILHYDIYFGLAAAFVLIVSAFKIKRRLAWLMLLWLASFILPWVAHSAQLRGTYEILLLLVGYIAMYWMLWRGLPVNEKTLTAQASC